MDLAVWAELFASEERVGTAQPVPKWVWISITSAVGSAVTSRTLFGRAPRLSAVWDWGPKDQSEYKCKQGKMKDVLFSESSRRDEI